MTNSAFIEMLEFLLAISVLFWLFKGPWQTLLIDMTRQRIFESRDRIFLYAADGRIDFDSNVYKEIRKYLNDSIRLCHRMGFGSLIASYLSESDNKNENKNNSRPLHGALNDIQDIQLRRLIKDEIYKSNYCIVRMMILRSIIALVLCAFYILYLKLKGKYSKFKFICKLEHVIERDIRMGDA